MGRLMEAKAVVRCAIYTRKSTEEGLEQSFNTLQAQRESAEAYILSQKQNGWSTVTACYDDGGFSGATIERPALERLLQDIEKRAIDCVVVYKVDRLSRSLLDFARLLSVFEQHGVSFVSVTQDFNTSTSLGRLTLNILLSFAQFEREIISERTRDKLSAARRKGKWTGGNPVLGYDIDPLVRRLVVNEREAERVREIFSVCSESKTLAEAVRRVNAHNLKTKDWISRSGKHHVGRPFQTSTLKLLLRNVVYRGEVRHKGVLYPGEQDAIVTTELWTLANGRLQPGRLKGQPHRPGRTLLQGLLSCACCQRPMSISHTSKGGTRYMYYLCSFCRKQNDGTKLRPVAVSDFEGSLIRQLEPILGDQPSALVIEQALERVTYDAVTRDVSVWLRDGSRLAYTVPLLNPGAPRRRSTGSRRVPRVSQLVALAIRYQQLLADGAARNYGELATGSGYTRSRLSQILLLTNLALAIQEELLFLPTTVQGRDRLYEKQLREIASIADWDRQRQLFRSLLQA